MSIMRLMAGMIGIIGMSELLVMPGINGMRGIPRMT